MLSGDMREADAAMCELNLRAQYQPGYELIPNAQLHVEIMPGHTTLYPLICGSTRPTSGCPSACAGGPPVGYGPSLVKSGTR